MKNLYNCPGSRQSGIEFHPDQSGSCNHDPRLLVLTWISFGNNNLGALHWLSNIYKGCTKK